MESMTLIPTMARPSSFGMSWCGHRTLDTLGATTFHATRLTGERLPFVGGADAARGDKRTHAVQGSHAWSLPPC